MFYIEMILSFIFSNVCQFIYLYIFFFYVNGNSGEN